MRQAGLAELARLSEAVQDADAAKLQAIRAEETRIRAQLAALDDRQQQTRSLSTMEVMPHNRLGGDILWQVWIGRRRRDLQIQLARCLARKGAARRALQKSFGKRSALENVTTELHQERARTDKIKALDTLNSLGILNHMRP